MKTIDTLIMQDGTLKKIDNEYNLDESNHASELNHEELLNYINLYYDNEFIACPSITDAMEFLNKNFND